MPLRADLGALDAALVEARVPVVTTSGVEGLNPCPVGEEAGDIDELFVSSREGCHFPPEAVFAAPLGAPNSSPSPPPRLPLTVQPSGRLEPSTLPTWFEPSGAAHADEEFGGGDHLSCQEAVAASDLGPLSMPPPPAPPLVAPFDTALDDRFPGTHPLRGGRRLGVILAREGVLIARRHWTAGRKRASQKES